MKAVLSELIDYRPLTKDAARSILLEIADGKYNPVEIAAFLTVYMMRNITIAELEGFRDAMLELCIRVPVDRPTMDVCGTGGDGKNTFNISTLTAFVVAAAGQPVAKHGNYGVSSPCGSSNVLEFLGCKFTNNPDQLMRSLDKANIFFMHAPLFHPAMKHVASIRKDLRVKTFFNMLGPMVNPAMPPMQMVGVFSLELARQYAYLFQQSSRQFVILHSVDGYDEVSLTSDIKYFSDRGEGMVSPEDLGVSYIPFASIAGGDSIEESARIFLDVIRAKGSAEQNAVVAANAGFALYCSHVVSELQEGVALAHEILVSGKAYQTFKNFIEINSQ